MNKHFSGKEFKRLASHKLLDSFIVRFNHQFQSIEFIMRDRMDDSKGDEKITKEIMFDFGKQEGCFLYSFAGHHNTTFQFFAQSLKPTDEVTFHVRSNGSELTKEKGMYVYELRARVSKRREDGSKLYQREMTLKTQTGRIGGAMYCMAAV